MKERRENAKGIKNVYYFLSHMVCDILERHVYYRETRVKTKRKLDIAIRMLEQGIAMSEIRYCPSENLLVISQRIGVPLSEVEEFADQVASRREIQELAQAAERQRKSQVTLLFTDDSSAITPRMLTDAFRGELVSGLAHLIPAGYMVCFRVRNRLTAEVWSRALGQKIEPTKTPLPKLTSDDIVVAPVDRENPSTVARWSYREI